MRGPIERVIVRLDASSDNKVSIETAVRLAAHAEAPLHGMFTEDEELLNLAGLPFAREVTLGGRAMPFTIENAELHLRAEAERSRRELLAAAKRARVKCSFEIVRGTPDHAALFSDRDLVIAGALSRPMAGYFRVASRWWSLIGNPAGPLLLARKGWNATGSVVVLLRERSSGSSRLLKTVAQVAAAGDNPITVICPPELARTEGFERWLATQIGEQRAQIEVALSAIEPANLRERLMETDCQLLVFEAGFAEGDGDRLRAVVERFACDILVGR